MNVIYKNISGTTPVKLIRGGDYNAPTEAISKTCVVHKCQIANTYSSAITVDVYLDATNIQKTESL